VTRACAHVGQTIDRERGSRGERRDAQAANECTNKDKETNDAADQQLLLFVEEVCAACALRSQVNVHKLAANRCRLTCHIAHIVAELRKVGCAEQ
jgi:hypothetical protein